MTCRCPMCGRNAADRNNNRNLYLRAGFKTSEDGIKDMEHKKLGRRKLRNYLKCQLQDWYLEY